MAKRLLIIGNGFDIDLGLKTRYSDFSKSNNWKTLMKDTYSFETDLLGVLLKAKEKDAWFDIEKTMNEYVRSIKPHDIVDNNINKDKANFEKVSDALSNYLKEEQENRILNEDSYAAQVLRMIVEVGGFEIYTFNYTNLENIANSCDV